MGRNSIIYDKIPPDDVLESLYKLRIRESEQLQTVLELYDYQKWKPMVKSRIDQKLRLRNFDARNERNEKWDRCSGYESLGIKWCWKRTRSLLSVESKRQCSRGDKCSFQHNEDKRAKPTPTTAQRPESIWKFDRKPCKNFLKGTCTKLSYDYWHPPECQFCKSESGCKLAISARLHTGRLRDNPAKGRRRMVTKVQWLYWKMYDSWFWTQPPESLSILRNSTKVLGPTRRVRFTKAAQRHANIRENKGPSLGKLQVKVPHQRSPYALKFEDRSQEEIEWQERCARGDAWRLAKNVSKLKETDKATSFSPSNAMVSSSAIRNKTGGQRVCCRSARAYGQQERLDPCRIGNCEGLLKVRRRLVTANGEVQTRRSDSVMSKNWIYSWQ